MLSLSYIASCVFKLSVIIYRPLWNSTYNWCQFFLSRHERPSDPDDPLNDQNIKDRYYGSNDPVADKIMKRAETLPSLNPPEDPLITTLYIGGLGDESEANPITEQDLRNHFYQYGEIRQITVVPKQGCAFIQVNTVPG